MSKTGVPLTMWLRITGRGQNLESISELIINKITGIRRWFVSRVIENSISLGYYDEITEKYVLGGRSPSLQDAKKIVTDTSVDIASSASHTLTCPANHAYKVTHASIKNSTDAAGPTPQITFTPSGGTAAVFVFPAGTQSEEYVVIGGSGFGTANTDVSLKGPIWMQAGDILVINDNNFGAADVMRKQFIFEDYTIG